MTNLIWDSLPADVPITPPEWHLRELERRVAAVDADAESVEPWEDVKARLSKKA